MPSTSRTEPTFSTKSPHAWRKDRGSPSPKTPASTDVRNSGPATRCCRRRGSPLERDKAERPWEKKLSRLIVSAPSRSRGEIPGVGDRDAARSGDRKRIESAGNHLSAWICAAPFAASQLEGFGKPPTRLSSCVVAAAGLDRRRLRRRVGADRPVCSLGPCIPSGAPASPRARNGQAVRLSSTRPCARAPLGPRGAKM